MPTDLFAGSSDTALVVSVARRNERALEEVHHRHAGAVGAVAVRVLLDRALAADVVQEVFVRLWERPERFDAARVDRCARS